MLLSQLPAKLNELDNNGDLALDLALSRKLESIATTLVNNKADVDMVDQSGWSLLHKAIQRGEEFYLLFLYCCFNGDFVDILIIKCVLLLTR